MLRKHNYTEVIISYCESNEDYISNEFIHYLFIVGMDLIFVILIFILILQERRIERERLID